MKRNLQTCFLVLLLCLATISAINIVGVAAIKSGMTLDVEDPFLEVEVGGKVTTGVEVDTPYPSPRYMVYLTIRGVPENAIGIFDPRILPHDGEYKSDLIIATGLDVQPGLYKLTITAKSLKHGIRETAEVILKIDGAGEETGEPQEPGTTVVDGLDVDFTTDKLTYEANETVTIEGVVKDSAQNSVSGASVSIQVDDPDGSPLHVTMVTTDADGIFTDTFRLPEDAKDGTYMTFVRATYQEYEGSAHSNFAVGESATPAISILSLTITAKNGAQDVGLFEPGTELNVTVQISNQGAGLDPGYIWLEIDDSRDVPIYIFVNILPVHHGVTTTSTIFSLSEDVYGGAYTANAYVSNGYISQGGVFLDKEEKIFIVNAPEPPSDVPPSVAFVKPVEGDTVSGVYTVNVTAWDDQGLSTVRLKIGDGDWIGLTDAGNGFYPYEWTTTDTSDGQYTLTANATDTAGQSSVTQVTITVDNTAPSVVIIDPANPQEISGVYRVNVTATDERLSSVRLTVENATWKGTYDITGNHDTFYYYQWDTATATIGEYMLSAEATDTAGNTAKTGQITVTVNNTD